MDRSASERERTHYFQGAEAGSSELNRHNSMGFQQSPDLTNLLPKWQGSKNHSNNHFRGRRFGGGDSSLPAVEDVPSRQYIPQFILPQPTTQYSPLSSPPMPLRLRLAWLSDSARGQVPMRASTLELDSTWATAMRSSSFLGKWNDLTAQVGVPNSEKAVVQSDGLLVSPNMPMTGEKEGQRKTYIRLRNPDQEKKGDKKKKAFDKKKTADEEGDGDDDEDGDEEYSTKSWNLRPRKPLKKQSNLNAPTFKAGGVASHDENPSLKETGRNTRLRATEKKKEKGKEKEELEKEKEKGKATEKTPKFSISLSKQEIADDFLTMTGQKPPRKPLRRTKQVQTRLDNLFPGLWLPKITPTAYKVRETHPKD